MLLISCWLILPLQITVPCCKQHSNILHVRSHFVTVHQHVSGARHTKSVWKIPTPFPWSSMPFSAKFGSRHSGMMEKKTCATLAALVQRCGFFLNLEYSDIHLVCPSGPPHYRTCRPCSLSGTGANVPFERYRAATVISLLATRLLYAWPDHSIFGWHLEIRIDESRPEMLN